MKKIVIVVSMCLFIILGSSIVVSAYQYFNNENVEVLFANNSNFSESEKQIITDMFLQDKELSETYGLKCILFGHDYKTEYVDVIQHKVRATKPRCLKEKYEVQICADCSDTVSTLIYSTTIDCCE